MKEVAVKAAKEAGNMLMKHIGKHTILSIQNGHPTTKEDKEVEAKVIGILKSAFPNHGILGEELGEQHTVSEYKWIIDPIDGTNNYIEGRDTFSVSIALEHKGEVILGVVYLPKRNEMFIAEKGKGATLNDKNITIGNKTDLSMAKINFSIYSEGESGFLEIKNRVLKAIPTLKYLGPSNVDPVFGKGSMAAEFCYLACGRIDGLIRLKQKPWDVAAGQLIAAEAGAKMCNFEGEKCSIYEGDYIAANPKLLTKIMELIKR